MYSWLIKVGGLLLQNWERDPWCGETLTGLFWWLSADLSMLETDEAWGHAETILRPTPNLTPRLHHFLCYTFSYHSAGGDLMMHQAGTLHEDRSNENWWLNITNDILLFTREFMAEVKDNPNYPALSSPQGSFYCVKIIHCQFHRLWSVRDRTGQDQQQQKWGWRWISKPECKSDLENYGFREQHWNIIFP